MKLLNIQAKPLANFSGDYWELSRLVREKSRTTGFAFEWVGPDGPDLQGFLVIPNNGSHSDQAKEYSIQDLELKKHIYIDCFDANNDVSGKYPHLYRACGESLKSYFDDISDRKSKVEKLFK